MSNEAESAQDDLHASGSAWGDLLRPTIEELDAIGTGATQGLSTGFAELDAVTDGLRPGQLITIASRSGVGKSTLALDFCRAAAIRQGGETVLFSLEMGLSDVMMRALAAEAGVQVTDMRAGRMTADDWKRMRQHAPKYSDAPLYIDDASELSAVAIKNRVRSCTENPGLIVVDRMQLMTSRREFETREAELSEFSRQLKLLAMDLEVPVVAVSSLDRGPQQRRDKKPQLSDLRESGSIEQDSDVVILLHRPDLHEPDDPRMGEADLIVAKNRNGRGATVTVAHQLHYGRFVDMTPE